MLPNELDRPATEGGATTTPAGLTAIHRARIRQITTEIFGPPPGAPLSQISRPPAPPDDELPRLIAERNALNMRIREINRQRGLAGARRGFERVGEFAGLRSHTAAALRLNGFRARAKVLEFYQRKGRAGLLQARNLGPTSADEIIEWLNATGERGA